MQPGAIVADAADGNEGDQEQSGAHQRHHVPRQDVEKIFHLCNSRHCRVSQPCANPGIQTARFDAPEVPEWPRGIWMATLPANIPARAKLAYRKFFERCALADSDRPEPAVAALGCGGRSWKGIHLPF